MRFFYVLPFVFALSACSPIDIESARLGVDRFHELYQSRDYNEIYREASTTLQKETSKDTFVNVLEIAETKHLGTFKKTTLKTEKKINHLFGNNEVELIYISEYSNRIVKELFVFENINNEMKLKGYKYDSIN